MTEHVHIPPRKKGWGVTSQAGMRPARRRFPPRRNVDRYVKLERPTPLDNSEPKKSLVRRVWE